MNKNDLLYVTLMILGFLFGGVIIIVFAPQIWWLGSITVFFSIVIALWVLSVALSKKKKRS